MIFTVWADGFLEIGAERVRCAVGEGGVVAAADKREGDGATPAGLWPMRRLLWRADRLTAPVTSLPAAAIRPDDAWCDDPTDPLYNHLIRLPYAASVERLWREDGLYDLVVVLGHNDSPPEPGAGSAIFLHLAAPEFPPTRGCVALGRADLVSLLARAGPGDALDVRPPDSFQL